MFVCKQKKLFLKKCKVIVIVQKHVRRFLAQALLRRLREARASQRILGIIGINHLNKRLYRYRREKAAVRIQKHMRGALARKLLKFMKYVNTIIKIQSYWRRALAVKQKKFLRKILVMCTRIQRFWKKRFRHLGKKATKIGAYWKMKKSRRAFLLFIKRKKAAIKVQKTFRMYSAMIKKKRLRLKKVHGQFKERRVVKYGKILFDRLQLSKKYTKVFSTLDSVVFSVCLKAIKSRAETRDYNARIIQGLLKMKRAKLKLRRLRRRKMIIKIQSLWRMFAQKKRFILRKRIKVSVLLIQRNLRMFLAKLKLKDLRRRKEHEEYMEYMKLKQIEEQRAEQQREVERKKEEAEKKKQQYFKQKDHIAQMMARAPKGKPQTAAKETRETREARDMRETQNKKDFRDSREIREVRDTRQDTEPIDVKKKKNEVIKNTEQLLKNIYADMSMKPSTANSKKSRGLSLTRNDVVSPKKSTSESKPLVEGSKNLDDLYKLFAKDPGFK